MVRRGTLAAGALDPPRRLRGHGCGLWWFKGAGADGFLAWWSANVYGIARVVDPTDLWALLVLPLGYAYFSRVDADAAAARQGRRGGRLAAKLATVLACAFAFAATSEDDDSFDPDSELISVPEPQETSAEFVIYRPVSELLERGFVNGTGPVQAIPTADCFRANYRDVTPPEGFRSFRVEADCRLIGMGDSTSLAFTAVRRLAAVFDTAFYGALDFRTQQAALRDLEAITADSAVRLLERDVVTRLRIGVTEPVASYLPCQ